MATTTSAEEVLTPTPRKSGWGSVGRTADALISRPETTIILVAIALIVYFTIRNSAFVSYYNIVTMTQYTATIAVIGAGEVLALDLAEVDLSSGQILLTAPWFVVFLERNGFGLAGGVILSLVICAAIGAFNGLIVVWLRVPSFIATLGTNFVLAGYVLVASSDIETTMVGETGKFSAVFGVSDWSEGLWALGLVLVIWFLLKGTVFGLHVTATGGNTLGAAEAGVKVRQVKVWCFVVGAFIAAWIGIIDSIRIGSLDPAAPGTNLVLSGIAAAVIGGTALTGGRATVFGMLMGAVVLGVLEDGFNLIGVSANWFILVEGAVILGAMGLNVQLGRLTALRRRQ